MKINVWSGPTNSQLLQLQIVDEFGYLKLLKVMVAYYKHTHCTKASMVTKNIRAVTYLPPEYYKKLKDYAKQQNLTESGALVEIVKQFFETNFQQNSQPIPPQKAIIEKIVKKQLAGTEAEILTLKAQIEQMQQLMTGVMSGKAAQKKRSTTSFVKPKLQPLKAEDLAKRLGVNSETVEKEANRGNEHFLAWSRSKDIGRVSWEKRGELYYPIKS